MNLFKSIKKLVLGFSPTFKKVEQGILIAQQISGLTNVLTQVSEKPNLTIPLAENPTLELIVGAVKETSGLNNVFKIGENDDDISRINQAVISLVGLYFDYNKTMGGDSIIKSQISAVKREIAIIIITNGLKLVTPKIVLLIEKWIGLIK